MTYPKQESVLKRLHAETIHALDEMEVGALSRLNRFWAQAKRAMKGEIMVSYREDFRGARWNLPDAKRFGTLYHIEHSIGNIMNGFRMTAVPFASKALNLIHRTSVLRHAWMLDVVTPNSYKVKIPSMRKLYEAGVIGPEESAMMWKDRWTAWMDAYQSALNHNLYMNVINESAMEDAADEVDATRAGTPSYDLWDAMARLFSDQSVGAMAQGASDVVDLNDDVEEIWQTRGDLRVCDYCDPNLGLTAEEADGDIPNHPNCRCYWRMVPKSYADLLRSGDADDRILADSMDARGLVPTSLIIRDPLTGVESGKMIVDFNDWVEGAGKGIAGGILQ